MLLSVFQHIVYYNELYQYGVSSYINFSKIIVSDKNLREVEHSNIFQKQSQRCSVKKAFSKILQNSKENNCVGVKKRPQYRCFPVNFAKFLRTCFLQNTSGGFFCLFQLNKQKKLAYRKSRTEALR